MRAHLRTGLAGLLVAFAVCAPVVAGASVTRAKSGCRYLKASEVEQVIARPVSKGRKPPSPPDVRTCGYDVKGALGSSVNVWVQPGKGVGKAGFNAAKKAFASDVEPVSGFGKQAFYVGGGLDTMYVLKSDTLVYVQYVENEGPVAATIKADVAKMMKIVLRRL